jgi:hypothetical protein
MVNVTLKTAKEHLQNVLSTGVHSLTVLGAVMLHSSAIHEQQTHKICSKPINEKRHKIFQERRSSKVASQHQSCCTLARHWMLVLNYSPRRMYYSRQRVHKQTHSERTDEDDWPVLLLSFKPVLQLSLLFTGLWLRRSGFKPRPVQVGLFVGKVVLRQYVSKYLGIKWGVSITPSTFYVHSLIP